MPLFLFIPLEPMKGTILVGGNMASKSNRLFTRTLISAASLPGLGKQLPVKA